MRVNIELTTPKVVCGFPGVGKSFLAKQTGWQDSDSSKFSWIGSGDSKKRNPDFPANYVDHIRGCHGIVLCSTHKEVRDALAAAGISFTLVYPRQDCKKEYIERYRKRGSPDSFITLLNKMWDDWIAEMETESRALHKVVLLPGEFLKDRI